ncbi:MAG: hypothetical protein KF718_13965 [Polyangiaceae bacterium]|nr:hypothetical protein [Polyangiaceae bacterium]
MPDVFLVLDTAPKVPLSEKRNRSYFVWEHGTERLAAKLRALGIDPTE